MRLLTFFSASIVLILLIIGCTSMPAEMPDDFAITFSWNTGSLPPRYRYDYVITIGPGAQGEFDYVPGYGEENDPNRWVTAIAITQDDLQTLYVYFREQGFFDAKWVKPEAERIGGSTTSLILTAFGKDHLVPSISALEGTELNKVEAAQDFVRLFVPDAIWEEMEARQAAYEAAQTD